MSRMSKEVYLQEKDKILNSGLDEKIIAGKCLCLWYEFMQIPMGDHSIIVKSSEIRLQS